MKNKRCTLMMMMVLFLAAGITAAAAAGNQEPQQPYTDPAELADLIDRQHEHYLLIDVRTPAEYASGYIPSAVNIPVDTIAHNPPEISRDSVVIVYCRTGVRSRRARGMLLDMGFTRVIDFGGYTRWEGELVLP